MKDSPDFSHVKNNQPGMVDISHKSTTVRSAQAHAVIKIPPELSALLTKDEIHSKKGPVFATAIIAGTMAVKNTAAMIPFCHQLNTSAIEFDINHDGRNKITICCLVKCQGATGVEMEALSGASVAALTIYDMCKSISHQLVIEEIRLLKKSGGKSDFAT